MKLLVFAHTPPPHHGQSYMVQVMLEGFGGDCRRRRRSGDDARREFGIECYHVNARLSKDLEDIGSFRPAKFLLLAWHCLEAIWVRWRHGVTAFYYVPAPGKHSALYRDWLVMALCRPFFRHLILHWHAAGLGKWLETAVQIRARSTAYRLMGEADQSIVLSRYNCADAAKLLPQHLAVVNNGVPDPCPDFDRSVLPRRAARFLARQALERGEPLPGNAYEAVGPDPEHVTVLYLAHCTREKGLFEAVRGTVAANREARRRGLPLQFDLWVAGSFLNQAEHVEFDAAVREAGPDTGVRYLGFVSGEEKLRLLREADLFCFPTYFANENQPVNLIEAMAFGLPTVTTRWRSLPEMFPGDYPGLVAPHSAAETGEALLRLATGFSGESLRQVFLRQFTRNVHLRNLSTAICSAAAEAPPV